MVHPTKKHSKISLNYNYVHFPYIEGKSDCASDINIILNPSILEEGKWIGMKTIHTVLLDNKSSYWEMWMDQDPFDKYGKPKNGWTKAATYKDKGVNYHDKDHDETFNYPPLTWRCHKDVCRIDGYAILYYFPIEK
jgi:hypothetical protein